MENTELNYKEMYEKELGLRLFFQKKIMSMIEDNRTRSIEIKELEEMSIYLKAREENWQKHTRELLDSNIKLKNKLKDLKRKIKKIKENRNE